MSNCSSYHRACDPQTSHSSAAPPPPTCPSSLAYTGRATEAADTARHSRAPLRRVLLYVPIASSTPERPTILQVAAWKTIIPKVQSKARRAMPATISRSCSARVKLRRKRKPLVQRGHIVGVVDGLGVVIVSVRGRQRQTRPRYRMAHERRTACNGFSVTCDCVIPTLCQKSAHSHSSECVDGAQTAKLWAIGDLR